MKPIKIASLLSLLGLLVVTFPQPATAGSKGGSFFFPPFGQLRLAGKMTEEGKGSVRREQFNTRKLIRLVVDAINQNEKAGIELEDGAYLWYNGNDIILYDRDGFVIVNLSNSFFGGNYLDMSFDDVEVIRSQGNQNGNSETDVADVQIVFNSNPPLFDLTDVSAPPASFILFGSLKINFVQQQERIGCGGQMSGTGFGQLENFAEVSIRWQGSIAGSGFIKF